MTFQQAREKLLQEFDLACKELRGVVADSELTNPTYPKLVDAKARVATAANRLLDLNSVERIVID